MEGKCGGGLELAPQNQLFNEFPPGPNGHWRQVVKMTPGQPQRIRFINTSAFSRYYVFIEGGYQMEVIEIDGVNLKPGKAEHKTAGLELAPGQRVSVVITSAAEWTTKRIMVRAKNPESTKYICTNIFR